MVQAQTRVQKHGESSITGKGFQSAVSLHSHTRHSKEVAEHLPQFIERIPLLGGVLQRAMKKYEDSSGIPVDFRRIYWTPPVSPLMVLDSEKAQISEGLGLAPIVSISDHDTIAAGLELQPHAASKPIPISVEWSVPFEGISFHLGVHNLPTGSAVEIMQELARYTTGPQEAALGGLLSRLDDYPETLLVFNHPCCNHSGVGVTKHKATARRFLARYKSWIHALEFNAMRPHQENLEALRIADEYDLPVVAGGDRHGCRPNAVLNLTEAQTWGGYVQQVRSRRESQILVMPAYDDPVRLRELQTVSEIVRHYPRYRYGYRQFTDRVFVDLEGYSWHPLSFYWSGGMPLWLRPLFAALGALGSNWLRPILRWSCSRSRESALATLPSEAATLQEQAAP